MTAAEQPTNLPAIQPATGPTRIAATVYDKINDPLDFINKIGATLYDSKMFGCENINQGRALAFGFITNRLDPFSWKARHHIVKGNITMSAEAMLADFRTNGGDHTLVARTPDRAAVELRHGKKKQMFEITWAEAQAEDYVWNKEAAGDHRKRYLTNGQLNVVNLKDNWKTPRRRMQMLWARVIADAVGAMMPEVSSGRQTPEELGVIMVEGQADSNEPSPSASDEGEVVDAEFTVTSGAENTEPSVTPATDELVSPDVAAAPAPTSAVEPPPSGPNPEEQAAAAAAENKRSLLQELKGLKDELQFTPDQWQALMTKYGVTTARDLPADILCSLVTKMHTKLDDRRVKAGTDPVSQWANAVAQGKSQAQVAAEGN